MEILPFLFYILSLFIISFVYRKLLQSIKIKYEEKLDKLIKQCEYRINKKQNKLNCLKNKLDRRENKIKKLLLKLELQGQ